MSARRMLEREQAEADGRGFGIIVGFNVTARLRATGTTIYSLGKHGAPRFDSRALGICTACTRQHSPAKWRLTDGCSSSSRWLCWRRDHPRQKEQRRERYEPIGISRRRLVIHWAICGVALRPAPALAACIARETQSRVRHGRLRWNSIQEYAGGPLQHPGQQDVAPTASCCSRTSTTRAATWRS
jgi:hypothetical protein